MGVRLPGASRGYEEMPGTNVPNSTTTTTSSNNNLNQTEVVGPELELASVSVVPDGM